MQNQDLLERLLESLKNRLLIRTVQKRFPLFYRWKFWREAAKGMRYFQPVLSAFFPPSFLPDSLCDSALTLAVNSL